MKKTILSLIAALSLSTAASAQEIKVGLQFTPAVSKLTFNNLDNLSEGTYRDWARPALSSSFGALVNFGLTDQISLQTGLNYLRVGENLVSESEDGFLGVEKQRTRIRLHYLEIPLLGQYHINDQFFVTAGPSGAIYLKSTSHTKTTYTDGDTEKTSNSEAQDDMNSFNLMLNVGVGYKHPISDQLELTIQPLVTYSLTNLYNEDLDRKSINYGLTAALTFGL